VERADSSERSAPPNPLLYVPSQPARLLNKDLEQAGIAKATSMGKLDFHVSRVSYINILLDRGVGVREAQALARHSTPAMTMNVYGRTRQEKLSEVVSEMAESVLGEKKRALCVHKLAVGAEPENATPLQTRELRSFNLAPAVGLEPIPPLLQNQTHPLQKPNIFMQTPYSRPA